jgi:hypothetical protein
MKARNMKVIIKQPSGGKAYKRKKPLIPPPSPHDLQNLDNFSLKIHNFNHVPQSYMHYEDYRTDYSSRRKGRPLI